MLSFFLPHIFPFHTLSKSAHANAGNWTWINLSQLSFLMVKRIMVCLVVDEKAVQSMCRKYNK